MPQGIDYRRMWDYPRRKKGKNGALTRPEPLPRSTGPTKLVTSDLFCAPIIQRLGNVSVMQNTGATYEILVTWWGELYGKKVLSHYNSGGINPQTTLQ